MSQVVNAHVLTSLDHPSAGPSYTVKRLAESLAQLGNPSTVLSLSNAKSTRFQNGVMWKAYEPDGLPSLLRNKLMSSQQLFRAIDEISGKIDVMHVHGLWRMPNIYPSRIASKHGIPLVLSPRGMLGGAALQYSSHAKRLFWLAYQDKAVRRTHCIHATAQSELEDIRDFGINAPVAIIPNGIDLPDLPYLDNLQSNLPERAVDVPYVLSLGRLHPKKGLDRLIAAFSKIVPEYPNWRLRIIGHDEIGCASLLARQVDHLKLSEYVSIEPAVYDAEKFMVMRKAGVFVLPTLHENFGMTVAESLAVETPVIATHGSPWGGLKYNQCGWWIPHGVDPLAVALREALSLTPVARRQMGRHGRMWMERDFGWTSVSTKMATVYSWLLNKAHKPSWIVD